jgi:hypothetical protein
MNKVLLALCALALSLPGLAAHASCVERKITLEGAEAADFALVLKNLSFTTKVRAPNALIVSTKEITCYSTQRGVYDDALPVYSCSIPTKMSLLTAKLLFDSMSTIGIFGDGALSHTFHTVKDVRCRIDKPVTDFHKSPSCEFTAMLDKDCV